MSHRFRVETGFVRGGERQTFARLDLSWMLAKPLYDGTFAPIDEYVLLQQLNQSGQVVKTLASKGAALLQPDDDLGGWTVP